MKIMREKYLKKEKIYYIALLIYSFILFVISILDYMDGDMFNIISSGNYILENGIERINHSFYLEKIPIVNQEWLWCLIVAFFHKGNAQLILNIIQSIIASIVICVFIKDKVTLKLSIPISWFIIGLLNINNMRLHLVSIILLLIECIAIEKYHKNKNIFILLLIPLSVLLEINLHGSFWTLHFIFPLIYLNLIEYKNDKLKLIKPVVPYKEILFTGITSIITLFINPYGYKTVIYFYYSMNTNMKDLHIYELYTTSSYTDILLGLIFGYMFLKYLQKNIDNKEKIRTIILGLVIIGGSIYMTRLACFVVILLCFLFKNFSKKELIILCLIISIIQQGYQLFDNDKSTIYSDMIKAERLIESEAAVFTVFNTGNYFEYTGHQIFIDSRPEIYSVMTDGINYIDEYLKMRDGNEALFVEYSSKYDYICVNGENFNKYCKNNPNLYEELFSTDEIQLYRVVKQCF